MAQDYVYDQEAEETGWFGPEILFGLSFKYLQPNQSFLDLGIGTGLSSVLFHKAGLEVHGLDNSPEMLEYCRTKGLRHLTLHNLLETPYPFATGSMDHIICSGVFPFFESLEFIFKEAARIVRPNGLFLFMVQDKALGESKSFEVSAQQAKASQPVTIYRHASSDIRSLCAAAQFRMLRNLQFTAFMDPKRTQPMKARCYVVQK
jgi:predicted TPR repeat methyltransferase